MDLSPKIKRLVKKHLNEVVTEIKKLKSYKDIYKVTCGEKAFRVEIHKGCLKGSEEQNLAFSNGINVPKILFLFRRYKIVEWIDGIKLREIWETDDGTEAAFKLGEQVGKLNCIQKDNLFLINSDLNLGNVIWTPKREVFIVDWNCSRFTTSSDASICKAILKRFKVKEKIDSFLKGYSKYKDTSEIISCCEKHDWKWPLGPPKLKRRHEKQ